MARTFEELEAGDLLPLVDALPELMTPASAALGVPSLTEPGEGVGQGWASKSTISGVSGRPQGDCYSTERRRMAGVAGVADGLGVGYQARPIAGRCNPGSAYRGSNLGPCKPLR